MKRAVIIDDEPAGIKNLQELILRYAPFIKVVGFSTKPNQGVALIEDYQPELVFLDINMPGMNGFELIEKLHYKQFKLIFTTAHEEHALKALKLKAYDYLLKPISIEDFKNFVQTLEAENDTQDASKKDRSEILELQVKDGIIFLRQKEIVSVHASGNYSEFCLENGAKHLVSKSIKEYESQLDPKLFFRCHHSHIINLSKVERFVSHDGFFAKMTDGSQVDISRKNKDLFLERLKNL
ncbi:MAG: response regulator transcription factor [Chitinophagaceae bacterium]|nr:response regulator transcription factor [Chitinophagaceae bacterium]